MRLYPAIDLWWPTPPDDDTIGRLTADLDEAAPTAIGEIANGVRIFFADAASRDRALAVLERFHPAPAHAAILVPDDDWAARSQAGLGQVTVDKITIVNVASGDRAIGPSAIARRVIGPSGDRAIAAIGPSDDRAIDTIEPSRHRAIDAIAPSHHRAIDVIAPSHHRAIDAIAPSAQAGTIVIAIIPSMGFGTGHHPSTRLCLRLLQQQPLAGRSVLDVGTGSGVLAMAASRLGADRVVAIDVDADALQSAAENVELNGLSDAIGLRAVDIERNARAVEGAPFDLVLANVTGAMLERASRAIAALVTPGGALIASGFEMDERAAVERAYAAAGFASADHAVEGTWTAVVLTRA